MKKNIFFVSFLLLVLLSAGLYFITEYIYLTILKDNKNSLKDNSLSIVEQISPEIKAAFLKSDDIALLYNIEKISKLQNISEAFIINKNMEILIHNDSNKWNKKFEDSVYTNAVEAQKKLIQQVSDFQYMYSLPINENSVLCVNISLDKLSGTYKTFKIKMYLIFAALVLLIVFIVHKLMKFFFLRPYNKTKQLLALNETKKKTIYWELITMARKDIVTDSSQITDDQLDKENIKDLFNFALNGDFLQKNDITAIFDTSTKILFCKDKDKVLFEDQKLNTHIVNATTNVELIKTVSQTVEKANLAQETELTTSNLNIKIIPVINDKNLFVGTVVAANYVGI